MVDVVKRGREVVFNVGDCVSVPKDFFGADYATALQVANIQRLFGRVEAIETGGQLTIRWDIDEDLSYHVAPNKVSLENKETPKQSTTTTEHISVVCADDYQTIEESTSKDNRVSVPARMVENYVLFSELGDHLKARLITTEIGSPVHNIPLAEGEGKFLITAVIEEWPEFDEDRHSKDFFIRWKLNDARQDDDEPMKGRKQKFELKIKGKK